MMGDRPFSSYWQSGYEGADHINHGGIALDMNAANGHQQRAGEDYRLLQQFGIRTVRESIGWRLVEKNGEFDFSIIEARVRAAQELGIQICWTLLHYGWPDDLDVYGDQFVPRFVRYCRAVAQFLKPFGGAAPVFSPVNEISFTSWGLSVRMFRCLNMDHEHAARDAKRQLVKAAIAGCDAIWDVIPGARMLHCDPLVHLIGHDDDPATQAHAEAMRQLQFEAFDMLAGRRDPELGGAPRYLDLMGVNYYDTNQWEAATGHRLWWHLDDARRRPLHEMLLEVHERYGRPLLLAETGHVGSGRGIWIREVAQQAVMARQRGVDIAGICLYPGIDRPDWENPQHWHRSGMWDLVARPDDPQARVLVPAYAQGLKQAQALTEQFCGSRLGQPARDGENAVPTIIVFSDTRWGCVDSRPQHVLSNIARYYHVIYVEQQPSDGARGFVDTSHPAPNVTVHRYHTPRTGSERDEDAWVSVGAFAADLLGGVAHPIAWFYTPMALPVLDAIDPALVVYDCASGLAAARHASQASAGREAAMLAAADLVFTHSASLRDAGRMRQDRVHCFPSRVDTVHFEQALDRTNGHPLQAQIAGPRLGFCGVIDETIDRDLVAALADAHPEWSIVLVGPLAGLAPEDLPQRSNIHYLGRHGHHVWPQFLAGWDVCLMPYLPDRGPHISRTTILEYMAGERPIVSTAVPDVQALYGGVVAIARDRHTFVAACESALDAPPAAQAALAETMRSIAGAGSWATVADGMHELIAVSYEAAVSGMRPDDAKAGTARAGKSMSERSPHEQGMLAT